MVFLSKQIEVLLIFCYNKFNDYKVQDYGSDSQ